MQTHPLAFESAIIHREMLPDGPADIVRLAGVAGFGDAHRALFSTVRRLPADPVLVMGPGSVATTLWITRAGGVVRHVTDSAAAAISLNKTLERNHLPCIQTTCDWSAIGAGECALALVHLPRGRSLQQAYLEYAAYHLKPGAKLIFVGAKNEGIKTAVADASAGVGQAGVIARKGGYHAAVAYCTTDPLPEPSLAFSTYHIKVDDIATQLVSCTGSFAPDRLDGGAAALIQTMQIDAGAQVLDMGCGTGLVALAAARRGAHVQATDVSFRATASARQTLDANGHTTTPVYHCHGATALEDRSVDTVVTNPPFHKGHDISFEVSQLFVAEAARVLRPEGSLFLVANAFLDYGKWLTRRFVQVGRAWEDRRFCVWHAAGVR